MCLAINRLSVQRIQEIELRLDDAPTFVSALLFCQAATGTVRFIPQAYCNTTEPGVAAKALVLERTPQANRYNFDEPALVNPSVSWRIPYPLCVPFLTLEAADYRTSWEPCFVADETIRREPSTNVCPSRTDWVS